MSKKKITKKKAPASKPKKATAETPPRVPKGLEEFAELPEELKQILAPLLARLVAKMTPDVDSDRLAIRGGLAVNKHTQEAKPFLELTIGQTSRMLSLEQASTLVTDMTEGISKIKDEFHKFNFNKNKVA